MEEYNRDLIIKILQELDIAEKDNKVFGGTEETIKGYSQNEINHHCAYLVNRGFANAKIKPHRNNQNDKSVIDVYYLSELTEIGRFFLEKS